MTNKQVVAVLLKSFGYDIVTYKCKNTSTNGGQFMPSFEYEVFAQSTEKKDDTLYIHDSGFNMVAFEILNKCGGRTPKYINEEKFQRL